MNHLQHRLAFFFALVPLWLSAQTASLTLTTPDSLIYSVYIDGVLVHAEHTGTLNVDSLHPGDCLLDLLVHNSLITHVRVDFDLDTLQKAQLELREDAQLGYRLIRHDEPAIRDYTLPAGQSENVLNLQVTQLKTATCAPPVSPSRFEKFLNETARLPFERDKVRKLETLLGKECLSTAQIRELIMLVEDDERRLNLLVTAYTACFDASEFHALGELLYLSRNRDRFNMLFND